MSRDSLLGTGWGAPLEVDARGRVALAKSDTDIEQAIRLIILTAPGERLMRPTFGCRIHELIFSPNKMSTFSLAAHYVEDSLRMWEPRINPIQVKVDRHPEGHEAMLVDITYEIRATLDRRTLVFPFYHIPEHRD